MPDRIPGTPPAEIAIDARLVRSLLREQHPDLAESTLRAIDAGWDNAIFRLGDDLAVRLPRREVAAPLLLNEQRWLPALADRLPIPVPTPVRIGVPGSGYPWHWSIVPWLRGRSAEQDAPGAAEARRLAEFLRALHAPAPRVAPRSTVRGVPLERRAHAVEQRLSRLREHVSPVGDQVVSAWRSALEAPASDHDVWLHGDLHARNVLVHHGAIAGIIDWGDMTAGDPATDLASIWMLLGDGAARREALACYGASEQLVRRAKGWAVLFGVLLLDTGLVDDPRHARIGAATLARIAEDHDSYR
ncbi:MAG TPA: aminoglycoside phosphotransferase family protein [Gemmatimonadaceae bacterium]|nr:aminoglycoside phosphotransferase family protein [Gemmatimonadaceae bacterium]